MTWRVLGVFRRFQGEILFTVFGDNPFRHSLIPLQYRNVETRPPVVRSHEVNPGAPYRAPLLTMDDMMVRDAMVAPLMMRRHARRPVKNAKRMPIFLTGRASQQTRTGKCLCSKFRSIPEFPPAETICHG